MRLHAALAGDGSIEQIPGLVYRVGGELVANSPAWSERITVPGARGVVALDPYYKQGGQVGVETKRGCPGDCAYCADPVAKGRRARLRDPEEVAAEVAALAHRQITTLHICDSEFNLPREHAVAICRALLERRLHERVQWYAYLAVVPFDDELAALMHRAGCVGVDFTADAASESMLTAYGHVHRRHDLVEAVRLCHKHELICMLDLLLGGPGETPETLAESIGFIRRLDPDCVGASLGMRLYPGTRMVDALLRSGDLEQNPAIVRHYQGSIDLLRPTFYLSAALGSRPARLVKELINGDPRFFPPSDEPACGHAGDDHNYSGHTRLTDAIARGARGAYWDILRRQPRA